MKRALLFLILPIALFAQTARFPSAIADDKDLTVQKDKAQSTLTGAMTASATSFTVVTGSKFQAGQIVTIDNEQMLVCSVVSNTVSVGYTACPNIDGRGYAGTTAASHANSSLVSGNVVSWNHNSLTAEVKAIESFIGVNGANLARLPMLNVSDFNFSAQTPGGSISAGSNSITMTPCPRGVNGTDTNHRLYLYDGSGTAEDVPITGGTCTSGATTGTVIVTAANSHSGSWKVKSATSGWFECTNSLASTGGVCLLPTGNVDLYGTMHLGNGTSSAASTVNNIRTWGQGSGLVYDEGTTGGATNIRWLGAASQPMIKLNGPVGHIELTDAYLDCKASSNQCSIPIISSHASETHLARLAIGNHPGFAIQQTAYENPVGASVGDADSTYEDIIINQGAANSLTAGGLQIGGTSYSTSPHLDVARSHYRNIQVLCGGAANSVGIQLQFTDASLFENIFTLNCGKPIHVVPPTGSTLFPGGITFYNVQPIGTSATATYVTGTWTPGTRIGMIPFHTGDGEAPPTHTGFYGVTDTGRYFGTNAPAGVDNVLSYGATDDNSTDNTTAFQNAITAALATGGSGIVYIPWTPGCFLLSGKLTLPNDGTSPPNQKTLKIMGAGPAFNGGGTIPGGGSCVNLQYSGTGGKITTLGYGSLEITGLRVIDTSVGNTTPFLYVTNTTVDVHNNSFIGSTSGHTATQPAIVLGGTTTTRDGTIDAPFGGYGSEITRNYFDKLGSAVVCRVYCNGIWITKNTIWANGGSYAIDIQGDTSTTVKTDGGEISSNLIEMPGRPAAIRLDYAANWNVRGNNCYDYDSYSTTACVLLTTHSLFNMVYDGTYTTGGPPYYVDQSGTNLRIAANSNSDSSYLQVLKVLNNVQPPIPVNFSDTQTGFLGTLNQAVLRCKNTSNTNNNWCSFLWIGQAGQAAAGLGVQFTDQTNGYAKFRFGVNGATGFKEPLDIAPNNVRLSAGTYLDWGAATNVASASSITPTGMLFHVTGTTTISTINLPTGFTGPGCIVMIPDGLWATNTAGNIALGTTAVVNKALHMCYDTNTNKWYPGY